MKKYMVTWIFVLALVVSLCACNSENSGAKDVSGKDNGLAGVSAGKESAAEQPQKDSADVQSGGLSDFSIKFGNIEITQLPVSVSVFEEDGWTVEVSQDGLSYASKDGNYVAIQFEDNSKDYIETLHVRNGNYENGVFDISKIIFFDTIDFAASTARDFAGAIDQKQTSVQCEFQEFDDYYYLFDFLNVKGFTSCGFMRENETDFNIYLSCAAEENEETSTVPEQLEKSRIIEERLYRSNYNESLYIYVQIYEDGGWELEQHRGASEIYVNYGYAQEAAGEYVQISGFNLVGQAPVPEFLGFAKLTMTEEELLVTYQDGDEEVYERIPLDSEIA